MGIEAAALIPTLIGGVASAAVSSMLSPKGSAPQAQAQAQAPAAAATQTAQAPVPQQKDKNTAYAGPVPGSMNDSLLTGPSGVQASSDQIGRNTMLG